MSDYNKYKPTVELSIPVEANRRYANQSLSEVETGRDWW